MYPITCYCAVDGALGVIRNAENTVAVRPSEIVLGVPCELRLRLFEGFTTPPAQYPRERFSDVAGWSFEMDTDFSSLSTVKLVADNANIALAEVTEGGKTYTEITIPICETYTAELASAMDGREYLTLAGELVAYDADHEPLRIVQIKGLVVRGRVAGLGEPTPIPTAAYDELARRTISSAIAGGDLINTSGAEIIASGAAASVVTQVSGGLQRQIDVLSSGGGAAQSGAIIENQPFSTTVGGYTITHTSNGGLNIFGKNEHGPGVSAVFMNGTVSLEAVDGENDLTANVTVEGGAISASYDGGGLGASANVSMGYNGVSAFTTGGDGAAILVLDNDTGGVTANGSAITQTSSAFGGTSLEIDTLDGGVKYVCQSALTALSIGSAAPGCNGTIIFTAADGAIITPPANVRLFGVSSYAPGSSYVMAVNGDMAVAAEAIGAEA